MSILPREEDRPMHLSKRAWLGLVALLLIAPRADAQSTTGTIRGHVSGTRGLAVPGVTIVARSPQLQGERVVVTSEHGDYLLSVLPAGAYTISYELAGFERQQRAVNL